MQKRQLGRSGLHVSPFCFGGNVFGWTADEKVSFQLLDTFVGAGFDFIDTADIYSAWVPGHAGGESETVIGNWLSSRKCRDKVVIASKVGMWEAKKGLKAQNIISACEDSLKRLKTDYIDLYQSHIDDAAVPMDESLGAYKKLVEAGKVRAIGASNFDAERLAMALKIAEEGGFPRYNSLQPLYNLVERDFEKALQPLCVTEEVGVIPYFALAGSFLTGKYRSDADVEGRPRARMVRKYLTPQHLGLLDRMDAIAKAREVTIPEIALAWLRDRPSVVAPIASATNLDQLNALIRSTTIVLTAEEVASLN